jgi:hypothetical protein
MLNPSGTVIPVEVKAKIQESLDNLLNESIPPYSVLKIELHIHDGQVKRIKTSKESQMEIT